MKSDRKSTRGCVRALKSVSPAGRRCATCLTPAGRPWSSWRRCAATGASTSTRTTRTGRTSRGASSRTRSWAGRSRRPSVPFGGLYATTRVRFAPLNITSMRYLESASVHTPILLKMRVLSVHRILRVHCLLPFRRKGKGYMPAKDLG